MTAACGVRRFETRAVVGGHVLANILRTVHFSKARRSDCAGCRAAIRREIAAGRRTPGGVNLV
jgi:hypothetical protein